MSAQSLYRQAMGAAFEELSPELQAFHSARGATWLYGKCRVAGPENFIGELVARFMGMPEAAYEGDFFFELDASPEKEEWRRKFKGREMVTRMGIANGVLVEQVGPLELRYSLSVNQGRLAMHIAQINWKNITLPRFMHPSIIAEEAGENDRMHFKVEARMPLIGRVVAYEGHLLVAFLMSKTTATEAMS
jgi:hypothetical protein